MQKIVAFDRFLARLMRLQPDRWILKGGFAIQLRLVDKARTTKDIDITFIKQTAPAAGQDDRIPTQRTASSQLEGKALR